MITNRALYNVKKTSIKRRIDLNLIKGITTSSPLPRTSESTTISPSSSSDLHNTNKKADANYSEFVLHVPSEYDYRYASELHRNTIIATLRRLCGCLAFFQKDTACLKMYTTTRKDKQKNISRMPQETLKAHEAI